MDTILICTESTVHEPEPHSLGFCHALDIRDGLTLIAFSGIPAITFGIAAERFPL